MAVSNNMQMFSGTINLHKSIDNTLVLRKHVIDFITIEFYKKILTFKLVKKEKNED